MEKRTSVHRNLPRLAGAALASVLCGCATLPEQPVLPEGDVATLCSLIQTTPVFHVMLESEKEDAAVKAVVDSTPLDGLPASLRCGSRSVALERRGAWSSWLGQYAVLDADQVILEAGERADDSFGGSRCLYRRQDGRWTQVGCSRTWGG